ncbi:MAG: N-acetyltransferase [Flavobacteriaceae bacterium]|nr:N-acetyltransferase [Flavobacteriaceae bacterium]
MKYSTRIFNYIEEVPDLVWESLSEANNVYFTKQYLKAFEVHNAHSIQFFYIVMFKGNEAVSFAILQVLEFDFVQTNFVSNTNRFVQKAMDYTSCLLRRNHVKVMICGSPFLSGEYGLLIKKGEDKKLILECLVKGIQSILSANKYLKQWVDVIILKDYFTSSLPVVNHLKTYNYTSIQVDANMVLDLKPEWNNFEDYLSSFKSKFRVKAKKAYKQSVNLVTKDLTTEEILEHKTTLAALYKNVFEKANFNWAILNIATYVSLKEILGGNFIFKAYFLEDKLVGFMSGVVSQNSLDAHYVGIDYSLNKKHAIYSRMLYDYVKIGIERKLSYINFGRTAGEIKSTLGAVPQELTCYVRHKKSVANFLFKPFIRKIKPSVFEQRFPFKKEK